MRATLLASCPRPPAGRLQVPLQHSIDPYFADFACLEASVIVELDGGQHTPEDDAHRTSVIEAAGFKILRFWSGDVLENMPGVLETVLAACHARTPREE